MKLSIALYKELLEFSRPTLLAFFSNVTLQERQFIFDDINELCYENLYYENKEIKGRQSFFDEILQLKDICKGCYKYYLKARNKSDKKLDIILGKQFEKLLIEFFKEKGIKSGKADDAYKNSPDNLIEDSKGNVICYYEVKFLTAPFVLAYKFRPGRECYEGSTTLDVAKKIAAQRTIVEKLDRPTYYVYWLDYPCIKGVFFMEATTVYDYIDKVKIEWQRKTREGDFNGARRIATIQKVYLPLLEMHPFSALFSIFQGNSKEAAELINERTKSQNSLNEQKITPNKKKNIPDKQKKLNEFF